MADGSCKPTALEPVGVDAVASTVDTLSGGSPGSPSGSTSSAGTQPTESMDLPAEPPRPLKESVIDPALNHLDAVAVFSKGRFSH